MENRDEQWELVRLFDGKWSIRCEGREAGILCWDLDRRLAQDLERILNSKLEVVDHVLSR